MKYDIIKVCSDGGTGIRVRLKIEWGDPCGFDSRSEHHFCTKEKPLAGPEKGKAGCQGEGRRRTGLCTGVRRRLWLAPPVAERRSVALPRRKVRNRQ